MGDEEYEELVDDGAFDEYDDDEYDDDEYDDRGGSNTTGNVLAALSGCAALVGVLCLLGLVFLGVQMRTRGDALQAEAAALKQEIHHLQKEAAQEERLIEELERLRALQRERK